MDSNKQAIRSEVKCIMKCYIDAMCKTIAFLEIKSNDQVEVVLKSSKDSLTKLLSIDEYLKRHKYDINLAVCSMKPRKSAAVRRCFEDLLDDMNEFLSEFDIAIKTLADITKKIKKHK